MSQMFYQAHNTKDKIKENEKDFSIQKRFLLVIFSSSDDEVSRSEALDDISRNCLYGDKPTALPSFLCPLAFHIYERQFKFLLLVKRLLSPPDQAQFPIFLLAINQIYQVEWNDLADF